LGGEGFPLRLLETTLRHLPAKGVQLKKLLPLASKPVRYLGREVNAVRKDGGRVNLRFCLAFPDVYEVGMSHLGIQILYHILNGMEGVSCERVFTPWIDMEKILREKGVSLSSLESSTPLRDFDILGFSLQYELCFSNVLTLLELSHIPFFSKDRDDRFPLVIAGGPNTFNPAPVADFFDAFVIGDGEEVVIEMCDLALRTKEGGGRKEDLLKSLNQLEGVYVPAYPPERRKIRKRIVSNLDRAPYPTCPIVPYMKVVHDRLSVEIARGCKRGCRFCEAGFIQRPYRERSSKSIEDLVKASLKSTGYEEFSLLSLSAGDYSSIGLLLSTLMDDNESRRVAASFPSLRIESILGTLAEQVKRVRKTGFTIAPEAGTERLRKVINKELDENVLFEGGAELFSKGWRNIKLYFMMGLPTEREEDLRGIIELSKRLSRVDTQKKIHPTVNVSVSTFVPKPHTPFQWEAQTPLDEMKEKLSFLKHQAWEGHLHLKWQDPHLSYLEGIFSTGGRDLSRVLVEAHRLGCRFDGWSDQFHYGSWEKAFEKMGVEMDRHTRRRSLEDNLPWSFVETGVTTQFLWEEYQKGLRGEVSPPCQEGPCHRCGVCDGEEITLRQFPAIESISSGSKAQQQSPKKPTRRKVRLRFKKEGDLRFISHLELASLFHRTSKRADLPLGYSEGFHPMPRIIFASALPVGVESLAEVVELELEGTLLASEVKEKLNQGLPPGIEIIEAQEVPLSSPITPLIHRSIYWIRLDQALAKEEVEKRIQKALSAEELLIHQERKGKQREVDILPQIEAVRVTSKNDRDGFTSGPQGSDENEEWGVELVLRRSQGKTAKPTEIMGSLLRLGKESISGCKVVKLE
jgi:radical SAM family uncharacterized protein/radical SAM-linked protein